MARTRGRPAYDNEEEDGDGDETVGGSARRPLSAREFPDEVDEDDDGTDPCPHCGAAIYIDGEWCPKCGKYLSKEDAPAGKSTWVIAIIGAVLFGMVLLALFSR